MKKSLWISAIILIVVSGIAGVIISQKNKKISSLQSQLQSKDNEVLKTINAKNALSIQVVRLTNDNSILQKNIVLLSNAASRIDTYNSSAGYGYPSGSGATVVYKRSGCDYFILEGKSGYIVAEWMGGHDPDEGETLFGNFNSYGTKSFVNSNNRESRLWIEDYWLSKESAFEKVSDECN